MFIEQGQNDQWEKIDNSSVLDGIGTGGSVAGWSGSGTSNTLTDAPITFSGSDVTFSGNVGVGTSPSSFYPGTHNLVVGDGGGEHAVTVYSGATSTGYLLFADGSSGSSRYAGQVRYDHNTDSMEFCVNNSSTAKLTINSSGNATFAGSINGGDINLSSTNNAIIDPLSVGNILRFTDNDPTQNNNQITGTIEWETKDSNNPGIQSFITTNSTNQGEGRLVFGTGLGGSAVERMRIDSSGYTKFTKSTGGIIASFYDGTYGVDLAATATGGSIQTFNINQTLNFNTYGTGDITFTTSNNSERMRITSTGNVGIGVTGPTTHLEVIASQSNSSIRAGGLEMQSYSVNNSWYAENLYYDGGWRLRSAGTATQMYMEAGKITFKRVASGSAGDFVSPLSTMTLDANGNVGIGTTSPGAKLHVAYSNSSVYSTTSPSGDLVVSRHNTSNVDNQTVGIRFDTTGFAGTTTGQAAIQAIQTSNLSSADLAFLTRNNATFGERMRITSAGELQVTGNGVIKNEHSSANFSYWQQTASDARLFTQYAQPLYFGTNASTKMTILSGGNVGIGDTTPTSKLTILGTSTAASNTPSDAIVDIHGTSTAHLLMGVANVSPYGAWINTDATGQPLVLQGVGGNVGIGVTNPNSYDSNADNLVIGSTGANDKNGITIVGGDTDGRGAVYFADTTQNSAGYISYFHSNNSMLFGTSDTTRMVIDSAGAIKFNAYDSTNNTGTPTYLLGTDASGNVVKTNSAPSPITSQAASLYDLIPNGAFTTTYAFTSTAGTYAEVMEGNDVITAAGTYSVQMFVNDYAVGGTQYSETYSGIMSWGSATNTNNGSAVGSISEIILHRSGHAANSGMTYLRTRETTSANGGKLKLEIMCNKTYTGASNVVFKFVRLI